MKQNIKFVQGNEACAEGALYAGLNFFAGYPITPSTEIAEHLAEKLPIKGGKFIQMEDEIASMCAIIGASLTGKKVMTATSGPGRNERLKSGDLNGSSTRKRRGPISISTALEASLPFRRLSRIETPQEWIGFPNRLRLLLRATPSAIMRFPSNIIAKLFGFNVRTYFNAATGAETAPKVNL